MKHYMALTVPDLPRTTTKKQWKAISWYLRVCRNAVETKLPFDVAQDVFINSLLYGTGVLYIPDNFPCKSISPLEYIKSGPTGKNE